jgi:hypothetical protein
MTDERIRALVKQVTDGPPLSYAWPIDAVDYAARLVDAIDQLLRERDGAIASSAIYVDAETVSLKNGASKLGVRAFDSAARLATTPKGAPALEAPKDLFVFAVMNPRRTATKVALRIASPTWYDARRLAGRLLRVDHHELELADVTGLSWINQPLCRGTRYRVVRATSVPAKRRCPCCGAIHRRIVGPEVTVMRAPPRGAAVGKK